VQQRNAISFVIISVFEFMNKDKNFALLSKGA
jgi:hypothetical protein